ncbi:MAG: ribulokinase, partial [Solirubrobacteraceae bacterium]
MYQIASLSLRQRWIPAAEGRLGAGTAEYPLHRKKDDPDHATQSHTDHMNALSQATRLALANAGVSGDQIEAIALATTGSSVIPVGACLTPL